MNRASSFDSASEELKPNKKQLKFAFLIESLSRLKLSFGEIINSVNLKTSYLNDQVLHVVCLLSGHA